MKASDDRADASGVGVVSSNILKIGTYRQVKCNRFWLFTNRTIGRDRRTIFAAAIFAVFIATLKLNATGNLFAVYATHVRRFAKLK